MSFIGGVACVSSTKCFAAGNSSSQTQGAVVAVKSGVPGTVQLVSAAANLNSIACWSASQCIAVGESSSATQGVVVPVTNGVVGTAVQVSTTTILAGVACERSTTTCFAVGQSTNGYGTILTLAAGQPGTATAPPGNVSTLNGVGCSSSTSCVAVGESLNGEVVPITNGSVGSPVTVGSAGSLFGAACPSSTVCDVVGGDTSNHALVVVVTNGVPASTGHVLTTISTFYGDGCFGAKCVAVGPGSTEGGYSLLSSTGVPGKATFITGTRFLSGVACETKTACDAVGITSSSQGVVATVPA